LGIEELIIRINIPTSIDPGSGPGDNRLVSTNFSMPMGVTPEWIKNIRSKDLITISSKNM
jgi:hypothetical protein